MNCTEQQDISTPSKEELEIKLLLPRNNMETVPRSTGMISFPPRPFASAKLYRARGTPCTVMGPLSSARFRHMSVHPMKRGGGGVNKNQTAESDPKWKHSIKGRWEPNNQVRAWWTRTLTGHRKTGSRPRCSEAALCSPGYAAALTQNVEGFPCSPCKRFPV